MSAHTKDGPWIDGGLTKPDPIITGGPLRLIKCKGVVIAFLPAWLDDEHEEAKANARLIAAAPDLLQALQTAREQLLLEGYQAGGPTFEEIDAAIFKATGKQP